jgi:hypothetical protein
MKLRYLYYTALVISMKALTSCTLTIHPDGSRTYGTDPTAAAAIIQELGDK